jgi:hypothetical protein
MGSISRFYLQIFRVSTSLHTHRLCTKTEEGIYIFARKQNNPIIVNNMFDETGRHMTRMGDKRGY